MLRIGLTGGIGSGKTTVARIFAELGVPVIDADEIAHELVRPGSEVLRQITAAFGGAVITAAGALDRQRLRRVIFADVQRRRQLEAIMHPRIRKEMADRAAALHAPYGVLCIPLLVEAGQRDLVDRVLVVDAPEALRKMRLLARDGMAPAEVDAALNAQARREERLAMADDVVVNDDGLATLRRRVETLHRRYLALARRP